MKRYQKIILGFLVAVLLFGYLVYPRPAEARGFFRDLIRFVGRTARFVVRTPGNIARELTRPLGPFLGPIAADVLLANAPNRILSVIDKASKVQQGIDTYESQMKKLEDARKILRDRASEVNNDIDSLRDVKTQLEQDLLSGGINYNEYKDKIISLNQVLSAYEETALRLNRAADNLKAENLIKLIGADALRRSVKNVGSIITSRVNDELQKLVNADLIKKFVGEGGMNVINVIDLILTGDISRILQNQGYKTDDPDFKNMLELIKKDIKNELKNNRNYLKDNWRELMDKKIKEILDKYKQDKNKNVNAANTNGAANANVEEITNTNPAEIPKDEYGCPPGYTWSPQSGISCIQTNCYTEAIPNAHWSYEGYCVCGSSGSISENQKDPNKECTYPAGYAKCPGCVYECVHFDEDCSLEGIGI